MPRPTPRDRYEGTLSSITVEDLRNLLIDLPDDAMVLFTSNYGDYYNTEQALPLRGDVEEDPAITTSAYSHSGFALVRARDAEDEEDVPDDEDGQRYVLIR